MHRQRVLLCAIASILVSLGSACATASAQARATKRVERNDVDVAAEAHFQEQARWYLEQSAKPMLPDKVLKLKTKAEAAMKAHRLGEADDRYREALAIAAWWPEGRKNRAIVLEALSCYAQAAREMKRFLTLVPDSPDAREWQDKIAEWEARPATSCG